MVACSGLGRQGASRVVQSQSVLFRTPRSDHASPALCISNNLFTNRRQCASRKQDKRDRYAGTLAKSDRITPHNNYISVRHIRWRAGCMM